MINGNKRLINESFADYKIRRKYNNEYLKVYRKGQLIWDSQKLGSLIKEKILSQFLVKQFLKKGGK